MGIRYYYTTAPRDYDYHCTEEIATGIQPERPLRRGGDGFRLVAIHDDRGGIFHEGQVPRYTSGLHATWEVGSQDAHYLGLPSDIDSFLPREKMPGETFMAASEAYARKLADGNEVEQAWCLRGFADGLHGNDHRDDAGEYAEHYLRGWTAAQGD